MPWTDCPELAQDRNAACNADPNSQLCKDLTKLYELLCEEGAGSLTENQIAEARSLNERILLDRNTAATAFYDRVLGQLKT